MLLCLLLARRVRKQDNKVKFICTEEIGRGGQGVVHTLVHFSKIGIGEYVVKKIKFNTEANQENLHGKSFSKTRTSLKNLIFESEDFQYSKNSFTQEIEIMQHLSEFVYNGDSEVNLNSPIDIILDANEVRRFEQQKNKYVTALLYSHLILSGEGGFLIMPRYTDFYDEFQKVRNEMTSKSYYKLFLEIATAVEYVHSKNVVIKDLKLENMLLRKPLDARKKSVFEGNEPWGVILADFGLSCNIQDEKKSQTCREQGAGTWDFISIDQLYEPANTKLATDIYTLARVIIWTVHPNMVEIADDETIYENHRNLLKILENNKTDFDEKFEALLWKMMQILTDNRPTISRFIEVFTTLKNGIFKKNVCILAKKQK